MRESVASNSGYQRVVTIISICILIGASIASIAGLIPFSGFSSAPENFISIYGERVTLDGTGVYARDSVSCAAQARGQDIVTLLVGIPLLGVGLIASRRASVRGKMLQCGALGYFLYTYASYSFLSMYNPLFLLYVALFSLSLFGFLLAFSCFKEREVLDSLKERYPRRFLGGYLIGMGILLALMWIARIVPPLASGDPPVGIEHYTTLIIQALDLGVVVPAAIVTGVLFLRRRPIGATLAGVLFIKLLTMALALFSMMIVMAFSQVTLALGEVIIFTVLLALGIVASLIMFRSVNPT